jgi:hypothetical protein
LLRVGGADNAGVGRGLGRWSGARPRSGSVSCRLAVDVTITARPSVSVTIMKTTATKFRHEPHLVTLTFQGPHTDCIRLVS